MTTRRQAVMMASAALVRAAMAADTGSALRMAISQTMVADVNLNDARAAMQTWIKKLETYVGVTIDIDPRIFVSSEEIMRGVRAGRLDAAALNVVEFRPIADLFDTGEIFVGTGASGPDEYVLLTRRDSDWKRLAHLKGRRLSMWTAPKMCVAPAWLATLLEEEHLGTAEEFLGGVSQSPKISAVVLPVFFRQADACVASRRGFETMCELNPQIARDLTAIAISPLLTTCFYAFRKGFHGATRDRFTSLHSTLLAGLAGKQLATLFQVDDLTVRDTGCLASSLSLLDRADRVHTKLTAAGHKG